MKERQRTEFIRDFHASDWCGVFSITGGGASSLGMLLSVPGGSRTVLEGIVPYHERSLANWLKKVPEQACSAATALAMGSAAFQRAELLQPDVRGAELFGIGCTAALASDRPKKGDHRVHVALQTHARTTLISLKLNKGARSRSEEEEVAAEVILSALGELIDREYSPELLAGESLERSSTTADPLLREVVTNHRGVAWHVAPRMWRETPEKPPGGLLCGSFNPLHLGHRELRAAAAKYLKCEVGYELSVTNVDKPPLDFLTIERRVEQTAGVPTAVTNRPLFSGKGELFPGMWFVVGMDTALRIVDPRYAGGSEEELRSDQEKIRQAGCRFLVAGRKSAAGYQTRRDLHIPPGFEELFVELPESDFREDLSSTELRAGETGVE